jgi:hypothetical protein
MILGYAEQCIGRIDAALGQYRQALDGGYRTYLVYAYLAATEALKGNDAEAKLALGEARRLNPQFTIKWFGEHLAPPPPTILDGWRKAGVPEE